ncbi:hypothetical protein SNE40_018102 [Patella caerulea]|uniref:Uncharacterized protein n=1 Tax=Patella caerulea TaxID=87958 RepID=A0AAN8PJD6_PATCE
MKNVYKWKIKVHDKTKHNWSGKEIWLKDYEAKNGSDIFKSNQNYKKDGTHSPNEIHQTQPRYRNEERYEVNYKDSKPRPRYNRESPNRNFLNYNYGNAQSWYRVQSPNRNFVQSRNANNRRSPQNYRWNSRENNISPRPRVIAENHMDEYFLDRSRGNRIRMK